MLIVINVTIDQWQLFISESFPFVSNSWLISSPLQSLIATYSARIEHLYANEKCNGDVRTLLKHIRNDNTIIFRKIKFSQK